MENLSNEVDDLLADVLGDKSKPKSKLNKIIMTTPNVKGTVMFVPIAEALTGKYYRKLKGVREFSCPTQLNERIDSDRDVWHKILPKECYTLTPEQEVLYDKVVSAFDTCRDNGCFGDELETARNARFRTYTLMYGWVLSMNDATGRPLTDYIGKPALLQYPTNKVVDALSAAIDSKKLAAGGSTTWVSRYFSKEVVNRSGAIVIKTEGGQGGYNISLSFEGNSEDNPYLIPADLDLTDASKLCQNAIQDFLGWQGDAEEGYFNTDLFQEMMSILQEYLPKEGAPSQSAAPASAPSEAATQPAIDPLG